MRIPRTNNVYGQLVAPGGLQPVLVAIEALLGPGCASLFHTRAGAGETLRIRSDTSDFESLPLPGGMEYLLNGAVAGSVDEVMVFVRALSAQLTESNIEHTFEVHDGRRVVLSLPE